MAAVGLLAGTGSRRAVCGSGDAGDVTSSGALGSLEAGEVARAEAGIHLLLTVAVNANHHCVKGGGIDAGDVAGHGLECDGNRRASPPMY